jgi:uncharacterized membrane protein YcaP (DUF421 family)
MHDLWHMSFSGWLFVLRAAVVYIVVLLLLRLGGKRQIAQMGVGEFVAILLISNAVQNSMNGGDNSVVGGVILAGTLIVLSVLVEYLTFRSKKLEHMIQGEPTLLIHKGQLLHRNMDKELLSKDELKVLLRRQGIHDFHEVETAVLESDGYLSITKKDEPNNEQR